MGIGYEAGLVAVVATEVEGAVGRYVEASGNPVGGRRGAFGGVFCVGRERTALDRDSADGPDEQELGIFLICDSREGYAVGRVPLLGVAEVFESERRLAESHVVDGDAVVVELHLVIGVGMVIIVIGIRLVADRETAEIDVRIRGGRGSERIPVVTVYRRLLHCLLQRARPDEAEELSVESLCVVVILHRGLCGIDVVVRLTTVLIARDGIEVDGSE